MVSFVYTDLWHLHSHPRVSSTGLDNRAVREHQAVCSASKRYSTMFGNFQGQMGPFWEPSSSIWSSWAMTGRQYPSMTSPKLSLVRLPPYSWMSPAVAPSTSSQALYLNHSQRKSCSSFTSCNLAWLSLFLARFICLHLYCILRTAFLSNQKKCKPLSECQNG